MDTSKIRNIAVIAHVDHGKTTLIDALLKQTHVFRENQEEMQQHQILDSNDLEREKGITILAKNVAIRHGDIKINIIDTPGHADFSGEVERTLGMADGALLIIDAQEGPMPQTRFVLKKAFELNLKVIVVVNKIDKPFANVPEVINKTSNLFLELATKDEQLDFPVLYAVGREGKVFSEMPDNHTQPGDVMPLLEMIVSHISAPSNSSEGLFKMLVSSLDYDNHLGKILIGKVYQGTLKPQQKVMIADQPGKTYTIETVFVSEGLIRVPTELANAGEIVAVSGVGDAKIGQTLTDLQDPTSLTAPLLSEPTLHMTVGTNTSPLAGKEGKFSTSRQIEERLNKELETNLSLRLEKLPDGKYKVSGKGELHLAILLESLRREGYEMEVGKPEVIVKMVDGVKQEPVEEVSIIVPQDHVGVISQELGRRQGEMIHMLPISDVEVEFVYNIPTRNIIGLKGILMTRTKGTAVLSSQLIGYRPMGQPLPKLRKGVLIAFESGEALSYGLNGAQGRGITFIEPATKVYEGMIVGQNAKEEDIEINVCKGKKLTNTRAASGDAIMQLAPAVIMNLEQSLDFLENDELLEITPLNLRLRKKYLTENERKRHRND